MWHTERVTAERAESQAVWLRPEGGGVISGVECTVGASGLKQVFLGGGFHSANQWLASGFHIWSRKWFAGTESGFSIEALKKYQA